MSCIPKILELKGDKEFIQVPFNHKGYNRGTVIETGGKYKGYDWLVVFQSMGFRCGYVAIPSDHPMNESNKSCPDNIEVHGGVTFFDENHLSKAFFGNKACTDKWIGFDAGHSWDILDMKSALKYFPDLSKEEIKHIIFMNSCRSEITNFDSNLRDKQYMEDQCKYMIDQLIEMEQCAMQ